MWVNIGPGNGLLPDDTKPLPEPMLTYHQLGICSIHLRPVSQLILVLTQNIKADNDINRIYRSDYELTKYSPYLALTIELWSVFCEYFGEKMTML